MGRKKGALTDLELILIKFNFPTLSVFYCKYANLIGSSIVTYLLIEGDSARIVSERENFYLLLALTYTKL